MRLNGLQDGETIRSDASADRETELKRRRHESVRMQRPTTNPDNLGRQGVLQMGCWQAYGRRIAVLVARGQFEQAHVALDKARDFRNKILKRAYEHKGESMESILPVDSTVLRKLWSLGYKSIVSLRNETMETLIQQGLSSRDAGDVMGAVAEYYSFLYDFHRSRRMA